jgi:hypothetical protein
VSDTGVFVYCTGNPNAPAFDAKIDFDIHLIPYEGNDNWVEPVIEDLHACLMRDEIPDSGVDCDYCAFIEARRTKEMASSSGVSDQTGKAE